MTNESLLFLALTGVVLTISSDFASSVQLEVTKPGRRYMCYGMCCAFPGPGVDISDIKTLRDSARSSFAFSERWRTCWHVFKLLMKLCEGHQRLEIRVSPEHAIDWLACNSWAS